MKAVRIFYDKTVLPDGAIVQMIIWQLPRSTSERPHGLKYSLFYGGPDGRIVGYDNESGKGDHKHIRDVETRYKFIDVETMVADFLADVERMRNEHDE
jgi:hypothetical protein